MKRRHSVTPTDSGLLPPANPAWRYSPPKVSRDGRVVAVDAMQLPMLLDMYRALGVPLVEAKS
jgi:hypothetical protein